MKYLLVYTMNLMLVVLAHAQGTFAFGNRSIPDGIDAPVFDGLGGRVSGNSFLAQLWGGPDANSLEAISDPLPFQTGAAAGYISTLAVASPNIPPGGTAVLEVRVWNSAIGTTFRDALVSPFCHPLGYWMKSYQFKLIAGGVPDPITGIPSGPTPLKGLTFEGKIPVCPEPSIIALELLGGLTLFFWLQKAKGRCGANDA